MMRNRSDITRSQHQSRLGERGAVSALAAFLVALAVACVCAGVAGGSYLLRTYTQIKDFKLLGKHIIASATLSPPTNDN